MRARGNPVEMSARRLAYGAEIPSDRELAALLAANPDIALVDYAAPSRTAEHTALLNAGDLGAAAERALERGAAVDGGRRPNLANYAKTYRQT